MNPDTKPKIDIWYYLSFERTLRMARETADREQKRMYVYSRKFGDCRHWYFTASERFFRNREVR